ncbi:GpE family phage tail protein [Pseudaestuariivita sp.]
MADIAAIFHWPLSEMDRMSLEELARFHALAVKRYNVMRGKQGGR